MLLSSTQTIAVIATGRLHRPRFHGPGSKSSPRRTRRKIGTAYEPNRPITLTETTAWNATDDHSDGSTRTNAPTAANQTLLTGVPVRGLTECHRCEPGIAPSREKAKICREL